MNQPRRECSPIFLHSLVLQRMDARLARFSPPLQEGTSGVMVGIDGQWWERCGGESGGGGRKR